MASQMRQLALFGLLALLATLALAQSEPKLYTASERYKHIGCYEETVNIANSTGERAVAPGKHTILPDDMTVEKCLDFCGDTKYAGLEYSRECWCSPFLSDLSEKVDDKECNLPCDGDKGFICGGSWKLTVYELQSSLGTALQPLGHIAWIGITLACTSWLFLS